MIEKKIRKKTAPKLLPLKPFSMRMALGSWCCRRRTDLLCVAKMYFHAIILHAIHRRPPHSLTLLARHEQGHVARKHLEMGAAQRHHGHRDRRLHPPRVAQGTERKAPARGPRVVHAQE